MFLFNVNWVEFDITNTRFYRTGAHDKINLEFVDVKKLIKAQVFLGSTFSIDTLNRWSL